MLRSVRDHFPGRVRAHLLHPPSLGPIARARLRGSCPGLRLYEVPEAEVADLPALPRIPRTMWYRTLLPELLAGDRVLYLDADCVAVDDLRPLWETDLEGALVGAVTNVLERGRRDPGYFNSGVLLIDLDGWRREGVGDAVRRAAAPGSPWPDQDALNAVLGARRRPLHPRWNVMNAFTFYDWSGEALGEEALREALARPGIRHFEGPSKPWLPGFRWPGREEYVRARRRTAWPGFRLRP